MQWLVQDDCSGALLAAWAQDKVFDGTLLGIAWLTDFLMRDNCPAQALNDLFEKILLRDVPARYLLRLGMGEQELATTLDFSRVGRVNAMLARRLELLAEVPCRR